MVFQDQNERKAKQAYLRDEVINRGYDPELFAEFLDKNRIGGQDIDMWNIAELETIVELFKRSLDQQSVTSKFKIQSVDLFDEDDEIYCRRMKCQQRHTTTLGDEPQKISVRQWEIVDGGFFTGKYVLFHIELKNSKTIVKRKALDFQWVRDAMCREFPGTYIPPVYRTLEKSHEDSVLATMAHVFTIFLRDCIQHPELRRSVALEKFLVVPNYDDFKEQQKNVENTIYKKDIRVLINKKTLEVDNLSEFPLELFKTKTGTVDMRISKNLKNFFHSYQEYLNHTEDLVSKVARASKDVVLALSSAKSGLLEIGDLFTSLHQVNQDFNSRSIFGKDVVQEKIFFSLQNAFICDVYDSQIKQFNTHMSKFFEYNKAELETIRELVKTRNIVSSEYYKNKLELREKKNGIREVQLGDLDFESLHRCSLDRGEVFKDNKMRLKFVMPESTRTIRRLGDYFAVFNNYIFNEIEATNAWRNKKSLENFQLYSDKQVKLVTQTHLIWAEIGSHLKDYEARVERNLQLLGVNNPQPAVAA